MLNWLEGLKPPKSLSHIPRYVHIPEKTEQITIQPMPTKLISFLAYSLTLFFYACFFYFKFSNPIELLEVYLLKFHHSNLSIQKHVQTGTCLVCFQDPPVWTSTPNFLQIPREKFAFASVPKTFTSNCD